jgi:hypothetical protein
MRDDTPEIESEYSHVRDYQSRRCPLRSAHQSYVFEESQASLGRVSPNSADLAPDGPLPECALTAILPMGSQTDAN